jgi:hypothetical protein
MNMMVTHAQRGEGFGLMDLPGELAHDVLDHIPPARINHTMRREVSQSI